MPQPWLKDVKRRTLEDIKEFLRPSQVYRLITAKSWLYKGDYKHGKDFYETRDRALLSLVYLSCGRISEVLPLTKNQFLMDEDPEFIIIVNMKVVKRKDTIKIKVCPKCEKVNHKEALFCSICGTDLKDLKVTEKKLKKKLPIRAEVPLPRKGPLAKFTELVMEYLNLLQQEDARLFSFGRRRAWQIAKHITGKWCHYFRSQGESWYGKIYDVFGLKQFVGVASIETLSDYIQAPWRQYRDKLLGK